MRVSVLLLSLAVPALASLAPARGAEPPKLAFRQDGEDLVVTTRITINGSEHVLLTNSDKTDKAVTLRYCVIQNGDRLVRHQKTVDIEWRLKKHTKGQEDYQVKDQVLFLNTAELQLLGDQVKKLVSGAATSRPAERDPSVQKAFDKLLDAIKAKDREAFVADATDAVKKETTQEAMDAFAKYVGSRLKGGYEATYLCHLKKGGIQVYLWKLAFKDGGDDLVALMALQDGKVGSLHFQ